MGIKRKRLGPAPNRRLHGTVRDAFEVRATHYREPKQVFKRADGSTLIQHGGLRLGQRIWNALGTGNESWPELFYCTDDKKAWALVVKEYQ